MGSTKTEWDGRVGPRGGTRLGVLMYSLSQGSSWASYAYTDQFGLAPIIKLVPIWTDLLLLLGLIPTFPGCNVVCACIPVQRFTLDGLLVYQNQPEPWDLSPWKSRGLRICKGWGEVHRFPSSSGSPWLEDWLLKRVSAPTMGHVALTTIFGLELGGGDSGSSVSFLLSGPGNS